MKGIIIYYSQTGNTRKIAEAIHCGASTISDHIDLAHIPQTDPRSLQDYDLIGIGMPVWCEREPVNVRKFIEDMSATKGKFVFVFCTHATLAGRFMKRIVPLLEEKAMTVIGWEDWYGGNVNPVSEKPYYTDGHPDDIDLKEAWEFGKAMLERGIKIANGNRALIPRLPQGRDYAERYGELIYPALSEKLPSKKKTDSAQPRIILNREICNFPACSLCQDHCPASCIDLLQEAPIDETLCEHCHFCENICPTGAILFTRRMRIDKKNPLSQRIVEDLMEYKKLRRFRPLVSFDEVGTILPCEEDLTRHPRLVLDQGVGVLPEDKK